MKYVIVGNGIVAMSTAFRLTRHLTASDRITVIGPRSRPGGATPAAAAMLNSFAEVGAWSLKSDAARYHFELSRMASRRWPDFERELVEAATRALSPATAENAATSRGDADRGTYVVNNTASDDWDDRNFDAMVQALVEFKEPFDHVHPADIPNYRPAQRLRATRAVYIRDEGWLNPRRILGMLESILEGSDRATLIDGSVRRLVKTANTVSAAEIENGSSVDGDVFLLANGARASALLDGSNLGLSIQPVFYGVGVSLEIRAAGHPHQKCVRTPNRGGACGVYTVPLFLGPDGETDHIVIGATNRVTSAPVLCGRLDSIQHLMRSAIDEINGHFYAAELVRVNVGWRPTTQDTYPLLGKTGISNLYVATGTKRDGFHLSPVLSDYMACFMTGGSVDERLTVFAPERPLIRDLSREDAVEIIVASLMSEQYQHGYSPSNVLMNAQVRDTYRKDIEALHDKVGAKDWGIHPELVNMYRQGHAQ